MSMSKTGAGLLSSGLGLMGSMFSMIAQRRAEKRQRDHEIAMYERQRDDNRKNWEMENLYNTPEAQMKRLKDAGLNPHLVYGNGAQVSSGDIQGANPQVSDQSGNMSGVIRDIGNRLGSTAMDIYDIRIKNNQADLLHQQALTQESTRRLQAAETNLKSLLSNKEALMISLGKDTYQYQVEKARLDVRKTAEEITNIQSGTRLNNQNLLKSQADTDLMVQQKLIQWQNHQASLSKIYQDIKESQQRVNASQAEMSLIPSKKQNLEADTKLKGTQEALAALDHFLASQGRNRNDSFVQQVLKGLLFNTALTPKDVDEAQKKVKDYLDNKEKYRLQRK